MSLSGYVISYGMCFQSFTLCLLVWMKGEYVLSYCLVHSQIIHGAVCAHFIAIVHVGVSSLFITVLVASLVGILCLTVHEFWLKIIVL